MNIKKIYKKQTERHEINIQLKQNSGGCFAFTVIFASFWCLFWLFVAEALIVKGPISYGPFLVLPKELQDNRFTILPYLFFFTFIASAILGRYIENSKKTDFLYKIYFIGSPIVAFLAALCVVYVLLYGYVDFK